MSIATIKRHCESIAWPAAMTIGVLFGAFSYLNDGAVFYTYQIVITSASFLVAYALVYLLVYVALNRKPDLFVTLANEHHENGAEIQAVVPVHSDQDAELVEPGAFELMQIANKWRLYFGNKMMVLPDDVPPEHLQLIH